MDDVSQHPLGRAQSKDSPEVTVHVVVVATSDR